MEFCTIFHEPQQRKISRFILILLTRGLVFDSHIGPASHHPWAGEAKNAGGICYPSGGGSLVHFTDKNSNTKVMDRKSTQITESWGVS